METKKYVYRTWDESTQNTGIKSIDKHHKKFVEIINRLVDILNGDLEEKETLNIFHKLLYLTESYFIEEELYFKQHNYNDLNAHRRKHQEFIEKITKFQKDYNPNTRNIHVNLMKFLDQWYKNHILKADFDAVKKIESPK